MFIDLNSDAWYIFKAGLQATSTGRVSIKSFHTQQFKEDLSVGTEVVAGWTLTRSYPAVIINILHEFFDCGTTRYTYYTVKRIL